MLDRNKVISQISALIEKIFPDLKDQNYLAQKKLQEIAQDSDFLLRVKNSNSSFLVPFWDGNLLDSFRVNSNLKEYSVLAVDGSQIYPDRHVSGANCFLINSGGCFIDYHRLFSKTERVKLFSYPQVFLIQDIIDYDEKILFSRDLVDLKREELELMFLHQKAIEYKDKNPVCFVDGSLIFWFLEGKQFEVKRHFLKSYLSCLDKFYKNEILLCGYISFPKSKEIINLIKLGLCKFDYADCISCHSKYHDFPCKAVDALVDTQIVRSFLKTFERSTIFYSNSKIVKEYPDHLKPCFFYFNIGEEIVRIETLKWIVQNRKYLDLICDTVLDQSLKGRGYPVVLYESHEQAVVKGPDREFFYHLIQKIGIDSKKRFFVSQKNLKKRRIGI
ncbi:DNA double-strand break repair nuclease NurA [Candidatus Babeliales bacterium]|nr:DNA double-strand break repair nuclease NurA [Candidatus Babeliales bacterium]